MTVRGQAQTERWTTEDGLVARDRAWADEAFVSLAGSELDRAYRLAGLLLGNAHDAEDATQDALLRAWRAAGSLRDPTDFQAWFDRILVNVCRDQLRRRGRVRFVALDPSTDVEVARDPIRSIVERDEVLRALEALELDERTVLVLHFWADLTLAATAERLGWPIGTVKSRLHRALEQMQARLGSPAVPDGGRR
jgi:RNA polymerase sigma-70 factor (ECF subfamily)